MDKYYEKRGSMRKWTFVYTIKGSTKDLQTCSSVYECMVQSRRYHMEFVMDDSCKVKLAS